MDIDNILIDGLEYVNWNRDMLEKAHAGGLTAIHTNYMIVPPFSILFAISSGWIFSKKYRNE